jgi:hypothetical protein
MNKLELPIRERNFNETTITAIMEVEVGGGHVCKSLEELLISLEVDDEVDPLHESIQKRFQTTEKE